MKSCEFLTLIKNFSSILNGDGSTPPTPAIPTVTSKNFTSISLKWDPVRNTSGSAVYLIQITFTGEQSRFSPRYYREVNRPYIKNTSCCYTTPALRFRLFSSSIGSRIFQILSLSSLQYFYDSCFPSRSCYRFYSPCFLR